MKTSVSLASAGEDFGRRKRLLHSLSPSVCHSRVNLEIAELRRKERKRGRLIFVVRPESLLLRRRREGKGGRKDPFFFTRFSARGHASSSGRNNIGK